MTENVLFAEERFDIQPLSLQNFPQATQTFHLDLPHAFAGQANFTAHILQRGSFITQQTKNDVPELHAAWRSVRTAI